MDFWADKDQNLRGESKGMAPRLLIQRLTPFLVARIRENQRLLSSSVSAHQEASSLLASPSPSSSGPIDTIQMTDNCIRVFYTYNVILFCTSTIWYNLGILHPFHCHPLVLVLDFGLFSYCAPFGTVVSGFRMLIHYCALWILEI